MLIQFVWDDVLNLGFSITDLQISRGKLLAAILLNSGTLACFFLLIMYLQDIYAAMTLNDPLWSTNEFSSALFFGFTILWSIIGSFIGGQTRRRRILATSILLGIFSIVLMAFVQGTFFAPIISFGLGASMGLGLPSSIAFVADSTKVEARARVSGIIILGTFVLAFIVIAIIEMLSLLVLEIILLLALTRAISIVALAPGKYYGEETTGGKVHLRSGAYRDLFLYLIPWMMFCVAAGLAWNLLPAEIDTSVGTMVRYLFIAVFGFVSGIAADRFGRKKPIIFGLIVLGVSFAMLGFLGMTHTIINIYLAISGIAWGSFFVVFQTIPGDLSVIGLREKFYGMGYILPISILFGLSAVPVPKIFPLGSESSLSQIMSFILFLSIIPILFAKETLPEPKVRERRLKEHMERIGKIVSESKQ